MRRALASGATRLRADLRIALTDRYRAALARRSRAVVLVVLVAGVVDRAVGAARFVTGLRGVRGELADRVAASRQRRGPAATLTLTRAAVGGTDELGLTLTGPVAATGIRLARGREQHDLTTVGSAVDGVVRLAGLLPASVCTGEPWQVQVLAGDGPIPVVTPSRAAVASRYDAAYDVDAWPPRLVLDVDRQLVLEGRAPADPAVGFEVEFGITTATVRWSADLAVLRLTAADGRTIELRSSGDAAGRRAEVEFAGLADGTWALAVGDGTTWRPLVRPAGQFPTLADLPEQPAVTLVRPDGRAAGVRIAYSAANRLTLVVGARA